MWSRDNTKQIGDTDIEEHMARTRALLTETEREHLRSDTAGPKRYQTVSRIRNRIEDELGTDIELLEEHHPELYVELKRAVCDDFE